MFEDFRNYRKWKWQRKTLDPQSSWGWQVTGSPIKDFEDDSGCAFKDDSGRTFKDDSGGHSRESGNPESISSFLLILILTSLCNSATIKHKYIVYNPFVCLLYN